MSKILFLADLHGNMPATLALEKEMEKIADEYPLPNREAYKTEIMTGVYSR